MRITTGLYKGRVLKAPKSIRPTQNVVRKAIFDILGDIEGLSFLELFAGSGAVGLEAGSRGAQEVVFVESNYHVLEVLKQNLSCMLNTKYSILSMDSCDAIKRLCQDKRKFDIIFLDPPYQKVLSSEPGCLKKTLQALSLYDILSPAGIIVIQHFKKESLPVNLGVLSLLKQSTYGDTVLSFFQKDSHKAR